MTIREFFLALRRRWRIVVACLLLALGLAAFNTLRTPAVYSATTRVYLQAQGSSDDNTQRTGTFVLTNQDLATYVSVLISPDVITPLRETLKVGPSDYLAVSGKVTERGPFLDLSATASDPQLAADAANALGPQLAQIAKKYSPLLEVSGQHVTSTTIAPAVVPGAPTSPNGKLNLLIGALAGLLAGIGVALIRQVADTRVREDSDITSLADVPILAHIPVDKEAKGTRRVAMREDPHGVTAEAMRRLRTNLMFVDVTTGRHSFVVTSPMAGEGKTTTAINLSLAIAHAGSRCLLIDGDLRHPSVGKTLGLDDDIGLTTLLLGQVDIDEAIQHYPNLSLDVLAAGPIPPNPSELISSMPMELLFHELSSRYDFIVIDSPPIVPVVDAMLLDRLAGGLLMVVATDRTTKRDLATAIKALETASATLSGFAVNFATGDAARPYAYGYHREMTRASEQASQTVVNSMSRAARREDPSPRAR